MSKSKKTAIQEYLELLIRARPNDAVKLAFMEPEDAGKIDGLELSLLSEVKRGANGAMEIKLVDRAELLERLGELKRAEEAEKAEDANFYEALDRAAARLAAKTAEEADEI